MARLNSSNPTVLYGRQSPGAARTTSTTPSTFHKTTISSPLKPKPKQKNKKNNGFSDFKIFEDEEQSDNDEGESADAFTESPRSNQNKPKAPLKLTHSNSITSGLSKRASQDSSGSSSRRSRSGSESEEEESSDKENLFFDDEAEEVSDNTEEEDDEEEEETGLHEDTNLEADNTLGEDTHEGRFGSEPQGPSFMRYREPKPKEELDDSEPEVSEDSDGYNSLDDFIVSDNEDLSYHDDGLEDEEDYEEEEEVKPPTPKPTRRRLMRGRKPRTSSISSQTQKLNISNETHSPATTKTIPSHKSSHKHTPPRFSSPFTRLLPNEGLDEETEPTKYTKPKRSPLRESINSITSSPGSTRKQQVNKMQTPPCSPTKTLRPSPSKTKIPSSPHRPSSDAFWSQELTNAWNDQWSPPKQKTRSRALERLLALEEGEKADFSADTDNMPVAKDLAIETPLKSPSKTAIKKAEIAERKAAAARKKEFDDRKTSFAQEFLLALDEAVSGGQINKLAQSTGGVRIEWSKTLRSTAGRAKWKQERFKQAEGNYRYVQHASIELAERIIDDENRLLNTLAHEYCHLANYMISQIRDQPHGTSFREWGRKCVDAVKQHPIYKHYPIEVSTKHSYEIDYKYVWLCIDCGHKYGRHSKSIDPANARCSLCKGGLQQVKPKPRNVSPKKKTPASNNGINQRATVSGESFDDMLESLGNAHLN
ncbi:hypothetical protein DPV78_001496 [Talaromyces pinophilus]|nr:hypothetical protein DPV78_001496 [Talaromyces pinophilus]